MEQETVVWYKSKVVWSAIVTVVSLISYLLGIGPMATGTEIASTVELVLALVAAFGAGIGQYVKRKEAAVADETEE